jgi:hypothetical protein
VRSAVLVPCLVLAACGPAPAIAPPHTAECTTIAEAIIGTWTREGGVMEVRVDGAIVRDVLEGAFRWTSPGRATIDIRGSHEEHTIAMMTVSVLLDVDADGHAIVWHRASPAPPARDECFDLRGSLVGRWSDGATEESFRADGRYARGSHQGAWQLVEAGLLELRVDTSAARRYRIALASPDTLVSAPEGDPSGDDPRGRSIVETRLP